ncbi:hypothetical protein 2200_scaffold2352_00046 [Bacteriophage sp.]|nr:hypothetical protein 2200_scaffold2352_00046 [Bacteriophage sp.]
MHFTVTSLAAPVYSILNPFNCLSVIWISPTPPASLASASTFTV